MPNLKILAASIIALSVISLTANANVFTATASIVGNGYQTIRVPLTYFNPSLGNITASSLTFQGSEDVYIEDYTNPNLPAYVGLHHDINFYLGSSIIQKRLPDSTAPSTSSSIHGTNGVNYTFDLNNSEATIFTDKQAIEAGYVGYLGLYSNLFNLTTRQKIYVGGAPSEADYFNGSVTETITYTPVPEPGSLALFGTALVMLAGATIRKRRKGSL